MSKWPCADCGQGVDAYVDPITGDETVALCYDCAEERARHRVSLVVGKKNMRTRRQEVDATAATHHAERGKGTMSRQGNGHAVFLLEIFDPRLLEKYGEGFPGSMPGCDHCGEVTTHVMVQVFEEAEKRRAVMFLCQGHARKARSGEFWPYA